jgi:chorismate mutase / prephenate dehydratase
MAKTKRSSRAAAAGAKRKPTRSPRPAARAKPAAEQVVTAATAPRVPLEQIRERIDDVDARLHELINERAKLAQLVGVSKHAAGHTVDFYRPERESQVLRLALKRNQEEGAPLRDEEVLRLFREIMSACLAQQNALKIGYLGPEGTFTQQAVLKYFGHSVRPLPLTSVEEVFHEVESGAADFGVVPIENSTEGTVNNTLDMFLTSPLKIIGEVELRIHQNLMGRMSMLGDIRRVCGHPQSLAQCRGWLQEHMPAVERVTVSSNAEGARRARDEDGTAAIAGAAAAEVYGLNLLVTEIEDRPDNTTRFLVIGRKAASPGEADRTTLLVSAAKTDAPGALYRLLEPLAEHGISLTRIESRPSRKKKWDYVFFIDVEGHAEREPLATALAELKRRASLYRVIGAYPKAIL